MPPKTDQLWASCPSAALLRSFDAGTLEPEVGRQLEDHLAHCPACEQTLSLISEESDTLVRALATLPLSEDDEVAFQELYATLCQDITQPTLPAERWTELLTQDAAPANDEIDTLSLPCRLGEYELFAHLGQGAIGTVYKARHRKLNRVVAIKVLKPERRRALTEFLREMAAVGQLEHPHIIRGTDAGEAHGCHYLVMEYVGGWDISRLVQHAGPLRITDACAVIAQAALGLSAAHRQGFIHRDVKPSNLLLSRQGQIRVLDLGLVTHCDQAESSASVPRGTADYMAPEQWISPTQLTPQTDLYGLGCTLYKLLTGEPPFRTQGFDRRAAHLHQAPPGLRDRRPDCPVRLEAIVMSLLAKQPQERPASAEALAAALAPWASRANLAELAHIWIPFDPDVTETNSLVTAPPAQHNWNRGTTWLTRRGWLAGVSGSIALGLGIWNLWPRSPRTGQLRSHVWRPLLSSAPTLWLTHAPAPPHPVQFDAQRQQLSVDAAEDSLWELGRPLSTPFRLRTFLTHAGSETQAGFFLGGRIEVQPGTHGAADSTVYRFHVIAVAPPADHQPARVVWQHVICRKPGPFEIMPLAQAQVESWQPRNALELRLGHQGVPQVIWNGVALLDTAWDRRFEGTHYETLLPDDYQRRYLGLMGLYHSAGKVLFQSPELQYEPRT